MSFLTSSLQVSMTKHFPRQFSLSFYLSFIRWTLPRYITNVRFKNELLDNGAKYFLNQQPHSFIVSLFDRTVRRDSYDKESWTFALCQENNPLENWDWPEVSLFFGGLFQDRHIKIAGSKKTTIEAYTAQPHSDAHAFFTNFKKYSWKLHDMNSRRIEEISRGNAIEENRNSPSLPISPNCVLRCTLFTSPKNNYVMTK